MRAPHTELAADAAELLTRLRARRPRVHCITNTVAQAFTANVLLAAGAIPSMTVDAAEVAEFVAGADALLINLGTFDTERREAAAIAVATANANRRPWVLDPVFIDRTSRRAEGARALLADKPRAIRCNRAEFETLAGVAAEGSALASFARVSGATVGLTGAVDLVSDGERLAAIANGDPLLALITALGCAASALVAAAQAIEEDAFVATAAGLLWIGVAGEIAARRACGPASLSVALIDTLHRLDAEALIAHARIT
jgi:hydroxyethylthiazole kinase